MNLSPKHLRRYKEIGSLFWKYGRSDVLSKMGVSDGESLPVESLSEKHPPAQLADDLEAMGPTFVKLGQILSSRPDLLPQPYIEALSRLQDRVKPFPFAQVEEIISSELGVRLSKAFSSFDPVPLAAASLGQVHSAALRDGRMVVVKVQRPDVATEIAADSEVLAEIAEFLDAHTHWGRRYRFLALLEEFRVSIQQELNYEREAQNLISMGENLREFELIQIPHPVPDYSARRVLTMDYIQGRKITRLGPLVRLEVKGTALAEELFRAYLKQVLVDGLFHADPHPGNVFLTDDGRIALLDFGMVGRTTPTMQEDLLKLLIAFSEGNQDEVADIVVRISQTTEEFNAQEFRRRLAQLIARRQDQNLKQFKVGRSLLEVSRNAADNGLFVPSELTMLGKTLFQLDEVGKILDPEFEPHASIRRHVTELAAQRIRKQVTPGNLFNSLFELKNFVGGLPGRVNRILDAISNRELELKVKSVDAKTVVEGIQKIANRITAGILLAALILGAAQLMHVETSVRIMGYPALAILCFLAATAGGFWLVITIFIQDHKDRRKTPYQK